MLRWITSIGQRCVASKECLYRRCGWVVMGIVVSWLSIAPVAAQRPQLKRPEQAPSETPPEPKPKKLVNEPRAVGVLQLNNSGKGTLIPIAIRIDGKFYDASIYKADPVPMALDVGTVYEVEKTGQSEGLFTVGGALHNQNPNSATPWLGAGAYVLNGTVAANNIHKAEDKPRGLDDDNDAPPRLTRGNEAGTGNQNSGGGSGSSGGGAQKTSTAGTAGSGSAAPGAGPQSAGGASGEGSTAAGAGSTSNSTTSSSGSDESGPPQLKRTSRDDSGNCGQQSTTSQSTKAGGQGPILREARVRHQHREHRHRAGQLRAGQVQLQIKRMGRRTSRLRVNQDRTNRVKISRARVNRVKVIIDQPSAGANRRRARQRTLRMS